MEDEIEIEGVKYISSKRASELSGYAQDYIGQLARGGHIDARRVGGLWHVSLESLQQYEKDADTYRPKPPVRVQANDPDSLVSFDGKDYVSAARAAKLTGYHQDYVGQLARRGSIVSRQVGNRWYVERGAILEHKNEKDRLLGAVQAQSVGIPRAMSVGTVLEGVGHINPESGGESAVFDYGDRESYLTYTKDTGDLIPIVAQDDEGPKYAGDEEKVLEMGGQEESVPIRINPVGIRHLVHQYDAEEKSPKERSRTSGKTIFYGTVAVTALTVVVILTIGFSSVKKSSSYTVDTKNPAEKSNGTAFTASAASTFASIGGILERFLVPELSYKRSD